MPTVVSAATIDLDDPVVAQDPFPSYELLRKDGSVQYLARHGAWIVLGHEEVQMAFNRPDVLSNRPYTDVDAVLLAADPPEHTAMRRLVSPYFSREVVDGLGTFAGEYARSLLRPRMDVVRDYAEPLSEAVAQRLVGFDDATVAGIRLATAASTSFGQLVSAIDAVADRAVIYDRLRSDGLDDSRARSLVRLFWIASTKTSERVISACVFRLLQHPEVRESITRDDTLVPTFIEEVMRLHQPEPMLRRLAVEDVVLGGVRIPAGAHVMLSLAAANRDAARYAEPAELRLDRGTRHLTFGHGIHYCIGAALGRAEALAAVRTLLMHAPGLRPAQPLETVRFRATATAHFVESLHVES
jgi:cytochrome P450